MNVIFLDIDGVLNTCNDLEKNRYYYLESGIERPNINIEKVEVLSRIVKKYNCKIVISSSWKLNNNKNLNYLFNLFERYEIECIGFTPSIKKIYNEHTYNDMWKENDIRIYLLRHPEIEHFCIIDDEEYDLLKLKDYLIKTVNYNENHELEGLLDIHETEVERILKKENKYIRQPK